MPKVKANDIEMYYEEAGRGPEPVVFVHGYTECRAEWIDVIPSIRLWHSRCYLGFEVEPECQPGDYEPGGLARIRKRTS